MTPTLPRHDVVLLGIGHTNAHVLRMWRMKPIPGARLTCVSNYSVATYSGMLPGVLAGQYAPERMEIDLVRLCASAGARLVVGEVNGLDAARGRLLLADRPPIAFDALSVGVGSVPSADDVSRLDDTVLTIKPMQTFLPRLQARFEQLREAVARRPLRIAVVGAGAGGVEIAFCLPPFVRRVLGEIDLDLTLVHAGDALIGPVTHRTAETARRELERRGVRLLLRRRVTRVAEGQLDTDDGRSHDVDVVIWATTASPPPLLDHFDLPKDEQGFLLTRPTLQTTADAPVFAVGDTGTIADSRTPKAGVYAVRQGPFLWRNLPRLLAGKPLEAYRPQRSFLRLFNTGDGRAIGEYRGISLHGRWMWKLKDAIDGRFMDKYQDYEPMEMGGSGDEGAAPVMRCAGCGGKVGGSVLSKVLAQLEIPPSEHVMLGLDTPDDAAVVRPPGGRPVTVTVDFFSAPLDDPYLVGRIAALNAASDVFALGARPVAALASAVVPVGPERQQVRLLRDLLAGGIDEFRRMGATLVGGHTIEGPQLTIGFTMLADQGTGAPRTKAQLRPGDQLILTKPLGTGVLLAAHMQARTRAAWMERLLASMLRSNQPAAQLVDHFDRAALTDVTGFGLAGHLLEMLRASEVAAELDLPAVPLLPGTYELMQDKIESTLAPANRVVEAEIEVAEAARRMPQFAALFDPQTSGGLVIGVPAHDAEALLAQLRASGDPQSVVIGRVVPDRSPAPRLRLFDRHAETAASVASGSAERPNE